MARTAPRRRGLDGVRVRMYRHGLGDCFLLSFPTGKARPFHLLIDCGVILGTEKPEGIMTKVAKDVAAATDGRVDLVVATHEHWDHVSGFVQARTVFEGIRMDRLWLAWTENPADRQARELRERRTQRLAALRQALPRLRAADPTFADQVTELLSFAGPATAGKTTADALRWLTEHAAEGDRFRTPGEPPLTLEGVEGVRVYVLGPPRDLALLHKDHSAKEIYRLLHLPAEFERGYFAAVLGAEEESAQSRPFDDRFRLTPTRAAANPLYQKYLDESLKWRRIEADWLGGVGELALQLDSDTNNTSLALAIELPSGAVLLFPGDAQVGNWLSWQGLEWEIEDGRRTKKVTGTDLLRRAVLYKVGHHGSHNATLKEKGLEQMTSPDLVALLPVDTAVAHDKKNWKKMPFVPLVDALRRQTQGRLLQSDAGPEGLTRPAHVSDRAWKAFTRRVTFSDDGLYVDYTVPME